MSESEVKETFYLDGEEISGPITNCDVEPVETDEELSNVIKFILSDHEIVIPLSRVSANSKKYRELQRLFGSNNWRKRHHLAMYRKWKV